MAHFAKVVNGVVEKVIVAEQSFIDNFIDNSPGEWIQTSYNTHGGIHYEPNSQTPREDQSGALRYNYAGEGYLYDAEADAFYEPQPFPSWTLNTSTYMWEAPVAYPIDGQKYNWNEENQTWEISE
jgi:hypothetical protein|tara:strand:+ start:350 stop:724 length:375 start_codon:yes stop_codon:yes gene_type:complete